MFVDSMQILQDDGYKRPSPDALCEELNTMLDHPYGYTFRDIAYRLTRKLPLPIRKVYSLATKCPSYQVLGCILYEYVKTKSALNQVCEIDYWYFKDRYLYCK